MKGLQLKCFDDKMDEATRKAEDFCRSVEVFHVSHNAYMIGYETYISILIAYK